MRAPISRPWVVPAAAVDDYDQRFNQWIHRCARCGNWFPLVLFVGGGHVHPGCKGSRG